MPEIKAVIFDMDGVLIDARDWHFEALNQALELFGFSIDYREHLAKFDGLPTRDKLELLSNDQQLPRSLHRVINRYKQVVTNQLIVSRCRPNFQHELLLRRLKSDGYFVGLASNSIRKTINAMLEAANLITYFDAIVSNEDVVHAKPNPEIYTHIIQLSGFTPAECLVVEDSNFGVQAATAASASVFRVSGVNDVTVDSVYAQLSRSFGDDTK
jgi:beta-phosphoglucomutase